MRSRVQDSEASGRMRRRKVGAALIVFGVLAWAVYGILHYVAGFNLSPLPFLVWHLAGVIPGSYLFGGSLVIHLVRLLRRCLSLRRA